MSRSELGLPASIDGRQALFLDGVRMSIEMAQISYRRLQSTLVQEHAVNRAAEAALDAWALVDTLNRLRVLIDHLPGLRGKSPGRQLILRALKPIEDLRNAVQHMDGEIGPLSTTNQALRGAIARVQQGPDDVLSSRTLLASVRPFDLNMRMPMQVHVVTPAGKEIESPAGPIELAAAGRAISLSTLVAASVSFGDRLARVAKLAIGSMPRDAHDHRLVLDVQGP